ncbi:DUF805 domain-containing protein [Pararhizobium gei]|uniref:DUF805 domain-containing protein n=1 Tax=Pararhizobium gei TaxID=1395951 RepID=UPI0023DA6877|nr:DUF805 domain-containing protein [Rhizobium gei]
MSFTQAVRSAFGNYATFSGRASRSAFWWFQLFCILTIPLPLFIDLTWFSGLPVFQAIFELPLVVPALALSVRRLHDIDRSGWWLLLVLIPILGWIPLFYFTIQPSQESSNRFGSSPIA